MCPRSSEFYLNMGALGRKTVCNDHTHLPAFSDHLGAKVDLSLLIPMACSSDSTARPGIHTVTRFPPRPSNALALTSPRERGDPAGARALGVLAAGTLGSGGCVLHIPRDHRAVRSPLEPAGRPPEEEETDRQPQQAVLEQISRTPFQLPPPPSCHVEDREAPALACPGCRIQSQSVVVDP